MTPASSAVASASPFGRSRSRCAVSGAMRTRADATARRRDSGLAPTSTIRTRPPVSTWDSSSLTGRTLARAARESLGLAGAEPDADVLAVPAKAYATLPVVTS